MNTLLTPRRLVALLLLSFTALLAPPPVAAQGAPSTDAWYVMDREAWLRTDDTRFVKTAYDLSNSPNLQAVPYQIGNWTGEDVAITNLETFPTLGADQIVYRGYFRSDGRALVLSIIGGSTGQSFHHPIVCYSWASWPADDKGTVAVPVGDGDVVLRYVVGRPPEGAPPQVDLSWYLWPSDRRDWGEGATQVRVTAMATESEEQALADAKEFAHQLFAQARRPAPSELMAPTVPAGPSEAPVARPDAPEELPPPPAAPIPAFRTAPAPAMESASTTETPGEAEPAPSE